MTLLATTRVEDLQLVNTETGERREVVPMGCKWPSAAGSYVLKHDLANGQCVFEADGSPFLVGKPWRIERRAVDADAELVKLARDKVDALLDKNAHAVGVLEAQVLQAHHAAVKAKAAIEHWPTANPLSQEAIAALDALRLTPPVDAVDPLLIEARNMLADDHREGAFEFYHEGTMMKLGAGEDVILSGRFDKGRDQRRYHDALKRGLELAERGEG